MWPTGKLFSWSSVNKELYERGSDILWFLNEHWNKPTDTASGGAWDSTLFTLAREKD